MTMKAIKFPKMKSRKEWAALGLSVGLIISGVFLLSDSQKLQRLAVLEDGMGTCFQRVAQTFTAKMIGEDRSVYLDKGFTQASEECFGEAASVANQVSVTTIATKAAAIVNKLANEVSFFHAKIHGTDESFAKNNDVVQSSHLNTRFQGLEAIREEALSDVAGAKAQARSGVLRSKIAFYLFAFFCPFAFVMLWWNAREQSRTNQEVEVEALSSLESGRATLNATKTLIDRVLANNDLPKTKDLFDRTYALLSLEGKGGLKVKTITAQDNEAREVAIEKVWQESEQADIVSENKSRQSQLKAMVRPEGPTTDLEATLSRHLDLISGTVFTRGIRLDLNIEEEAGIRIKGKSEELEQILFHALSEAVTNAAEGSKQLSVSMKRLGGIALVNIDVQGSIFSEEILLESSKVARTKALPNVDLQIARELVQGIGKISFENTETARRTQFVFNVVEKASDVRVKNVTKATKRELKEMFANQN